MKIIDIKELFDGKALGIEFDSGQKCTSWNDKNNPERIRSLIGVNVEPTLKPYVSKSGKTGINLVGIEVLEEGAVEKVAVKCDITGHTTMVNPDNDVHGVIPKPEVFLKDDKIVAQVFVKCATELMKQQDLTQMSQEDVGMGLCGYIVELHGAYKLALDRLNA